MKVINQIADDMMSGIELSWDDRRITRKSYDVKGSELELEVTRVAQGENRGAIEVRVNATGEKCFHQGVHTLERSCHDVENPLEVVQGLFEPSAGSTVGYSREDLSNILEAEV